MGMRGGRRGIWRGRQRRSRLEEVACRVVVVWSRLEDDANSQDEESWQI